MTTLGWKRISVVLLLCAMTAIASPAQTFRSLVSFDGPNGGNPYAALIQGTDGNFYGTTTSNGANGVGTIFKITPAGTLTTLYDFCAQKNCTDGSYPYPGLVQRSGDGNLYGTTSSGGAYSSACSGLGCGTVFKMSPDGKLTTLYSFNFRDGEGPNGLVQGIDGNFYGTTAYGANICIGYGCGTVFKITAEGRLTTLHRFCPQAGCIDGGEPYAGLVQGTDGNFYGTTSIGGTNDVGEVFKISRTGKLTTLYSFCSQKNCRDGSHPSAGLVQGSDGNFYGTTHLDGPNGAGTVFKISPSGKLTTLHSFCSVGPDCADGGHPFASLVQATDGNFYGTTFDGGAQYRGVVFRISPGGVIATLYSFCSQSNCADGSYPEAGLLQATNGIFYGVTVYGGTNNSACTSFAGPCGTVFSLSTGLSPFVSFVRGTAKVGKIVEILGQGFTGTTGISFNGTAAVFKVKSDTYLNATVPAGATTGPVTVTSPGGLLTSNVPFRVRPQILSFSPTSGPVGTPVTITGVSLTQTTKVHFNGVSASFTVNSDTQVTATVPRGAKTGPIAITAAGGKTWSTGVFTVTQ